MSIPRGAQIAGKCGSSESELHISWINHAFTFRIFFSKVIVAKADPSESLQHFTDLLQSPNVCVCVCRRNARWAVMEKLKKLKCGR